MKTYRHLTVSRSVPLRMRSVSDKNCRQVQNKHFMISNFFFSKILPLMDKVEKQCRAWQATDDNMVYAHCVCWIIKAPDTHSEYVILIAFPLQQWLQERASMLHCTFIACLVSKWPEIQQSRWQCSVDARQTQDAVCDCDKNKFVSESFI